MKTAVTLTLALFVLFISNPVQAQDASNDATWGGNIGIY